MSAPSISIVIPTRNRAADLRLCLQRLLPQLPGDGSVDIHICDDSDGAETAELLRAEFPGVARHVGPRRGPGANRNVGARSTSAEWLIFLDDDCLPRPGLLAGYREAFAAETTPVFFAGPVVRGDGNRDSLLWEAPHCPGPSPQPPSCNFAMKRGLFLKVGGFDERYRYSFEDMELFARLAATGIPVRFVAESAVDHPSRRLPSPAKLALRWESRVISSFDFGAGTAQVALRLPRHIILVILSRFRGPRRRGENLRAGGIFLAEMVMTFAHLPAWILRYRVGPFSAFWVSQVRKGGAPPRFGL